MSKKNIIVIDAEILDLIDVIEGETVHIFNVENGYSKDVVVERAPRLSKIICLYINTDDENFIKANDSITLLGFGYVEDRLIKQYKMKSIDYQDINK